MEDQSEEIISYIIFSYHIVQGVIQKFT